MCIQASNRRDSAHGICRWLSDAPNGNARLAINGQEYEVEQTRDGYALYTLKEDGQVVQYILDIAAGRRWTCTCPDAMYRRQGCCKHVRATRAAIDALPF